MEHFFQLLRYSIGASDKFPEGISQEEWEEIHELAHRQALLGVMMYGIQKNADLHFDRQLLLRWFAESEQIRCANQKANRVAVELCNDFREQGFCSCILKGQGNALMYLNPYTRTSGDIDVWVRREFRDEGLEFRDKGLEFRDKSLGFRDKGLEFRGEGLGVRDVIRWVKKRNPEAKACYHHIDYGEFQGVEVEVHYRPSFMNNLIHNQRLQRWFEEQCEEQFAHEVELPDGTGNICVPTWEFNVIYQLCHIYHHVLHEGIGLRQVVDYFFLLKSGKNQLRVERNDNLNPNDNLNRGMVIGERLLVIETLRWLGLEAIAGALMWVLSEVLGLEDEYLIAPKDERLGRVLLSEMMRGGNFGQYDADNIKADNQLKKNWQRLKRDFRMMRYFPSECLWEPVFRLYHFFWRLSSS